MEWLSRYGGRKFGIRLRRLPLDHRIAFAVRDDDTSFFTDPAHLKILYRDAWSQGFVVSLSVIPFQRAGRWRHVPTRYRHPSSGGCYPLRENSSLVAFMKERVAGGDIDVVQHGYCHDAPNGGPEFATSSGQHEIPDGLTYLQETTGKNIMVFVPPYNFLCRAAWRTVKSCGLVLCRHPALKWDLISTPLAEFTVPDSLMFLLGSPFRSPPHDGVPRHTKVPSIGPLFFQRPSAFLGEYEAQSSLRRFKHIFRYLYEREGCLVVHSHYWEYFYPWEPEITRSLMHEYFLKELDFVGSHPNVWRCGLNELAHWLRAWHSAKVRASGSRVEIEAPFDLPGLSIRGEIERVNIEPEGEIVNRGEQWVFNIPAGGRLFMEVGGRA